MGTTGLMVQQAQILILDFQSDGLRDAAEALRQAGYNVLSANSRQTALEAAHKLLPAVVVVSMVPPDLQGGEISREIKSSPKLAGTKIVHIWTASTPALAECPNCDADSSLTLPVTPQILRGTVEAMVRLKQVEDQLRRSNELWRMVFAKSREATLLVDDELRIVEANPKATELFDCEIDQLRQLALLQLCPEEARTILSSRLRMASLGYAMVLQTELVRKDSTAFPAEIQARRFQIDARPHFEIIVRNLNDDLSVEFASRAMTRELDLLTEYSSRGGKSVTAALYAGGPISQLMPAYFEELASSYASIVDLALEEKTYQVDHKLPEQLCVLAARMGRLRAAPRDVVELHTTVLTRKMADSNPRKKQAYNVEGRFMLIELLGYLATYYRDRVVGSLANGSSQ
ncbi:MAG TPA: PAS domain S-box protein [Candidatus Angelobacter sp.]|nr:PAS domain S-box protein [Candidatus Angelobacter sp.]